MEVKDTFKQKMDYENFIANGKKLIDPQDFASYSKKVQSLINQNIDYLGHELVYYLEKLNTKTNNQKGLRKEIATEISNFEFENKNHLELLLFLLAEFNAEGIKLFRDFYDEEDSVIRKSEEIENLIYTMEKKHFKRNKVF